MSNGTQAQLAEMRSQSSWLQFSAPLHGFSMADDTFEDGVGRPPNPAWAIDDVKVTGCTAKLMSSPSVLLCAHRRSYARPAGQPTSVVAWVRCALGADATGA